VYEVLVGRFDRAESDLEEAREIAAAVGNAGMIDRAHHGGLVVASWRGREAWARALADETMRDAAARGVGGEINGVYRSLAILDNGLGHYEAALAAAGHATAHDVIHIVTATLPELVEAAARSGRRDVAAAAVDRLAPSTLAGGTDLGLGMLARSRALVARDGEAEDLYQDADQGDHGRVAGAGDLDQRQPTSVLEHVALERRLQRREDEEDPQQAQRVRLNGVTASSDR